MTLPFETITVGQVAHFPRPGTTVPGAVRFTPEGDAVTYLFSEEGSLERSLWRYDLETGVRTVLAGPGLAGGEGEPLSREEELRRERARLRETGVTAYQFARRASEPVLLVPVSGQLFVSIAGGPLCRLEDVENAVDPRLSDDGRQVAFVRDGELWVALTDGSAPPRVLTSGACDGVTNGLAEFIAQEELDRGEGFWWSPDGRYLAFERADSRHIPRYPIVHQGKDTVEIEEHRYPFAGQPNAAVELCVVDIETGATVTLDLGEDRDVYLARVAWRPDGVLTAQLLSRDQNTLRMLAFEPGFWTAAVLLERRGEPWINLDHDTHFLESGEVVRTTERSGFRHLYLNTPAARAPRQLTRGDWAVTRVVSVDEKGRMVYFLATRESVLERHLYSVSLDGGEPQRLTLEAGWHDAVVSPEGTHFADTWSTLEHGPRLALHRINGSVEAVLFANEGASAAELGLDPPELIEIAADDGTPLFGAVYRPPGGSLAPPRPLVVSVYGGPHAQRVADDWSLTVDLRAQYLSRQGFVVLKLDNRGSANRGIGFEAHIAGCTGRVEVADQAAGVRYLADRGEIDPARVGIYGWSYGGYITCMAMMLAPGIFRVGVAGAPVTHWDGYDTAYTERYMGQPAANPDGYRDSSVLAHVDALQGRLLLVHGMIDENVHFRHTARLLAALAAASKDCDLLIYPSERHMPRDEKGLEHQERHLLQYFQAHL